jgi:endonuclease YncB( thermonuclease family)
MYRFSVRLKGIDCPEMKSHNKEEKELAQIAQKKLSDLVLHKTVHLKNIKLEKYGRLLADVYLEDLHLNNYMITNKLAVEYDGKTKHTFT